MIVWYVTIRNCYGFFVFNVIRSGADKLPSDSLSGLITRTLHCHLCRKVKLWCNRVTFQTATLYFSFKADKYTKNHINLKLNSTDKSTQLTLIIKVNKTDKTIEEWLKSCWAHRYQRCLNFHWLCLKLRHRETRLHSSRMRTARALTVSPSMLCGGGWGGVLLQGDVCSLEECLVLEGSAPGGVASQHALGQTPLVNRMTDRHM